MKSDQRKNSFTSLIGKFSKSQIRR